MSVAHHDEREHEGPKVLAEKTSSGSYRVWVQLPVAGTLIEQYGLKGPWAAETYVDGASVANAQAGFTLQ